ATAVGGWLDDGFAVIGDIATKIGELVPSTETILGAFQPIKDAFNTVKGWFGFGGDDGGNEVDVDSIISIDASAIGSKFESEIAGAIDALSGVTIGEAIGGLLGRSMIYLGGALDVGTDFTDVFETMEEKIVAAF